jgi:hypothetical protein
MDDLFTVVGLTVPREKEMSDSEIMTKILKSRPLHEQLPPNFKWAPDGTALGVVDEVVEAVTVPTSPVISFPAPVPAPVPIPEPNQDHPQTLSELGKLLLVVAQNQVVINEKMDAVLAELKKAPEMKVESEGADDITF